MKTYKIKIKLI